MSVRNGKTVPSSPPHDERSENADETSKKLLIFRKKKKERDKKAKYQPDNIIDVNKLKVSTKV
jgi:hypothetical protein